ncbi:cytosine-purine permease [Punctularia strigosozonata HHB-11173 SS5]|uniref:cytosine-purine permease n=1 Tax=Punctularia strigosozonata (strain HHB-11173) TaxID=741275 RepID=UPI0004417350|nr:cytosine-purine permease [Punctularia strigosozonata HHB-11173 SS5]EIN05897.1 cytosine-purine permease [Punctularia strigosozonata HHB-11173 SS5]
MASWLKASNWELEPDAGDPAGKGWSNKDMEPVPPHLRTWSSFNYVMYWISDATNVAVWELASSMIAIGLTWRQALPAIALGHIILSIVMVANGTIGARLHVPFPVMNRSSFGFYFSYFSVISRVVLSMFWFGIQTFSGGECMLKAIWPSLAHLQNGLPSGSNITTSGMICYFIYWLVQFPLMFVSPQNIRWLFVVKGIVVPCAWLAMLIWSFVPSKSPGGLFVQHSSISGSDLSWAWLAALNSALGLYSTLTVNIPDFTRYAKDERAQFIQLGIIPIAFTFCGFIGMAVTSAGIHLYGEVLWDPLRLIDKWDNRAAAFFASFAFVLTTLGTNISANSLSAGNDMTALLPKYINIRRGQVICAILGGWAMAPWEILANATGFLNFMNGYTVFLGPFAGIMVTDYWLVHRCKVDVPAMYLPHGRYRYVGGVNWRAAFALLCSVPPTVPGLIKSINSNIEVGSAKHLFDIAWLFGFIVSSLIYYASSTLFPAKETYLDEAIHVVYDEEPRASISVDVGDENTEEDNKKFMPPRDLHTASGRVDVAPPYLLPRYNYVLPLRWSSSAPTPFPALNAPGGLSAAPAPVPPTSRPHPANMSIPVVECALTLRTPSR